MKLRIISQRTLSANGEEEFYNELPYYGITFTTKVSQGQTYIVQKALKLIKDEQEES